MNDFYEDLTLEDEDSEGVLKWSQIIKIWRINNLPQLDDELEEFLLWLAMRNSDGSNRIYIQKFFLKKDITIYPLCFFMQVV